MNLHELVSQLIIDTKGTISGGLFSADSSIGAFLPEIILCITMVLVLFARLFKLGRAIDAFYFALAGGLVALAIGFPWVALGSNPGAPGDPATVSRMEIFTGMLVYDKFIRAAPTSCTQSPPRPTVR